MHRRWVIAGVTAIALVLLVVYSMVDPAQATWMPKCLFHELTGWQCPGCGSQRMAHALLHGRLAQAWSFNPFIFIITPVVTLLAVGETWPRRWPRLNAVMHHPAVIVAIGAAIVLWTIVRNTLINI